MRAADIMTTAVITVEADVSVPEVECSRIALDGDLKALYRDTFHINLSLYHGDDEWSLPIPGRFVIDREGVVQYAESNADYRQRPDPDEALATLRKL